jgi:hypothetical protein
MIQLFFLIYGWVFAVLARLGLAKPLKPVNQPKMMIEALGKKEMNGMKTNGKSA